LHDKLSGGAGLKRKNCDKKMTFIGRVRFSAYLNKIDFCLFKL